mmetsp:Transcript_14179/g.41212  ORF Transcript_14179/g.41212 Transcript_14179/m.41212 type:complete len:204 (+) Transcript_14179:631-1242(+)
MSAYGACSHGKDTRRCRRTAALLRLRRLQRCVPKRGLGQHLISSTVQSPGGGSIVRQLEPRLRQEVVHSLLCEARLRPATKVTAGVAHHVGRAAVPPVGTRGATTPVIRDSSSHVLAPPLARAMQVLEPPTVAQGFSHVYTVRSFEDADALIRSFGAQPPELPAEQATMCPEGRAGPGGAGGAEEWAAAEELWQPRAAAQGSE